MSTDTLTADRLSQLLSSCRERATSLIQSHIQGEGAVGTIYEELERWYDRYRDDNLPLPQYQDLPSPVQDQLFDAWIDGVEGYFAKRAAKSDSADSPLPVSVAPAASCASPAPLVPEVVKEALETVAKWKLPPSGYFCTHGGEEVSYGAAFGSNGERDYMQEIAESALTALRSYTPVSSPSVELLREAAKALQPFAHPDLSERAPSMPLGDDAPVYGRNSALLHLGDFRRAVSTLTKLNAALA